MSDNIFSNDLFGPVPNDRKKPKTSPLGDYGKQRYLPYVRIPVEYTAMIAVAVIVMVTVAYALGVQIGRSGKVNPKITDGVSMSEIMRTPELILSEDHGKVPIDDRKRKTYAEPAAEPVPFFDDTVPIDPYEGAREDTGHISYVSVEQDASPGQNGDFAAAGHSEKGPEYLVYLAAFTQGDRAKEMAERLKLEGIDSGVKISGNWHQVYAGGYSTIEEARAARTFFSKRYPDCYIRKVE